MRKIDHAYLLDVVGHANLVVAMLKARFIFVRIR